MITAFFTYFLLGLVLSLTPGAMTVQMVNQALRKGFLSGWFVGLGGLIIDRNQLGHTTPLLEKVMFLFKSQKGTNPITTIQVYRILNNAADFLGRDDIGTHTIRKTFGYHHYKRFKNVAIF